jgi:hypothetical protein
VTRLGWCLAPEHAIPQHAKPDGSGCPGVAGGAVCRCGCHGERDPYDKPVFIQGHSHAEPVCAWPDCETYLTRDEMRDLQEED